MNNYKFLENVIIKKNPSTKEILEEYYDIPKKIPTYKIKQFGFNNKKELIQFYTELFFEEKGKTPKEYIKGVKISYKANQRREQKKIEEKNKFNNQSVIYKYTEDDEDDLHEGTLKKIIKDNNITGNNRIIISFGNQVLRDTDVDIQGNINNWWDNNHTKFIYQSPLYIFQYPLSPNNLWNGETLTITITKNTTLLPEYIIQNFLDSANTHCFFTPILEFCDNAIREAKTTATEERYKAIQNKITTKISTSERYGYIKKYENGIPENEIQKVCDDLRISINVEQPFSNTPYLKIQPQKKALKVFNYINTRTNHLELITNGCKFDNIHINDFKNVIILTREEMREKQQELDKCRIEYIYKKDKLGVCCIKSISNVYSIDNDFINTISDFEKSTGLDNCSIDYFKNPTLTNFLIKGTHYNGTIDFKDNVKQELLEKEGDKIKHIDISKAYTQFKKSRYYTGFCGKITDFRKVNNYNQKGLYYIDNINFDKCIPQFIKLNNSLKWFRNKNIYTDAELTALADMGGIFDVKYGAYGLKLDFEFNNDMLNKKEYQFTDDNGKEIKVPYYSKFCGIMGKISTKKKFYMKGDKTYLQQLRLPETTELKIPDYTKDETVEGTFYMDKDYATHKIHITSQITAYQRLNMLEQLLNMNYDNIIRICVDGIYYYEHEFKINDIFGDKHQERNFKNTAGSQYLSMVDREIEGHWKPTAQPRDFYKKQLFLGGGGCGKTHINLTDEGLINVIYIAPSWKLASYKKNEFNNLNVSVLHRLVNEPYSSEIIRKYNNYIIDEASFIKQYEKEFIFKNCGGKLIFCGDLGFQLEPVISHHERKLLTTKNFKKTDIMEMNKSGFDNITYCNTNYRSGSCKKLMKILSTLREMIKNNFNGDLEEVIEVMKKQTNTITKEQLKQQYIKEDLILSSENHICDEYTETFKHLEKYRIEKNSRDYNNGEIVYKKIENVSMVLKHGYTIHCIQGETASNKLYIDATKNKSLRMLYTAISRARTIEQVLFIN